MMEENMMEEEDYFLLRQRGVNSVNLYFLDQWSPTGGPRTGAGP